MKEFIKKIIVHATGYQLMPVGTLALDVRQIKNIPYYFSMFSKIEGIPGNIVECGVGKGRTFLYFSHLIREEGSDRMLWGFDSFEGFPEPTQADMSKRNPRKGEWSGVSPLNIQQLLRTAGVTEEFVSKKIRLVKGYVEETLQQYDGRPIALLHIDLDLYEGYRVTLERLVPCVSKGGIVMLDEYNKENWPGATKAVNEFLAGTLWSLQHDEYLDKYYFVKT